MGVIFQNGFGVGTVPNNTNTTVFWDNNYKSNLMVTYPTILGFYQGGPPIDFTIYKSSISNAVEPGVYSALGKTPIAAGEKRMMTYRIDDDLEPSNPNYILGFATRNANINGSPIGADDQSVAITNEGNYITNDNTYTTGLPTFGNIGDIIDVAIEGESQIWYRVNGSDWNGNVLANPATSTSGLEINTFTYYPAISLWGFNGPSVVSVYETSPYGLPSGFTQIPGDRKLGFTLTSDSFDSGQYFGSACGGNTGQWNGSSGFTVSQVSNLYCGVIANVSGDTLTQITNAYTAAGATPGGVGYIFDVVWGPGSTVTNGVAKFIYENGSQVVITSVDPTDTRYLNSDNDANNGTQLAGTFNFPATFTFRQPLDLKGGWC